ncbi:HAL/PAL/TAL family ammonia-lyase [Acidaminobacter hydrogenoformans]|uniref:Histidine ammonia-lyase n=1 Tax=Acidaminobacter hydrogenoformans DSM 2784 TaxID=1120920 RepID=A0A1G5S3F1_9FIRM|nr:aromatic amino acid ammonia-lyase [Acidaminobacter hydrogenoformans]SCZ80360.1 histidine ammonia-lyase [Acidaminobacter hydrogenoformans DSM 2784]
MRELESEVETLILDGKINIEAFLDVCRRNKKVEFSNNYCERVNKASSLVEKWTEEERVIYGTTTGFGILCKEAISKENASELSKRVVLSCATSVGDPLTIEQVRGIMLMVLLNVGTGYTGARLSTIDMYRKFLNIHLTPYVPKEGSVGYLTVEAHLALNLIGEGKTYYKGKLMSAKRALKLAGLKPIKLSAKEGLVLTSSTTAVTALGLIALYDMINSAKAAIVISSMSLEVLKGTTRAFDERLMSVRPHEEQEKVAKNIRKILEDSQICRKYVDYRIQDALSLRSISQLHGSVIKTLKDAHRTLNVEMNSCCDNPIIWPEGDDGESISGCNCDSSYVGLELDSASIGATMIAKMSERRSYRLLDSNLSEFPWFLIKNPGLNCGMMMTQYTQAGLLNDMKMMCQPSCIDNIPTCGGQEDYVAMGYNSSKKALKISEFLDYILAIELLSVYQAHQFMDIEVEPGTVSKTILLELGKVVPIIDEDTFLNPYIEEIKKIINSGKLVEIVESVVGTLEF